MLVTFKFNEKKIISSIISSDKKNLLLFLI